MCAGFFALCPIFYSGAMKVYKATIVPRGSALGMVGSHDHQCFYYSNVAQVAQLPEKDELQWSRKQLLARLDVAMGGRVAEEIVFGAENVTSGVCVCSITDMQVYNYCVGYQEPPVMLRWHQGWLGPW